MNAASWLELAATATVAAIMPGPCVAAILLRAASNPREGLKTVAGLMLADLVLITAALGVLAGALVVTNQALAALRTGGVLLLAGMGVGLLLRGGAGRDAGPAPGGRIAAVATWSGSLAAGAALGLSSPFNIVFFGSVLPLHLDPAEIGPAQALAAACAVILGGGAAG